MLKPGVVPGTQGWDNVIGSLYLDGRHPADRVTHGYSRHEVISNMLMHLAGRSPEYPCDPTLAGPIIEENWPGIGIADHDGGATPGPADPEIIARLRAHTSNIEDFLYGKKEYRKKEFLGVSFR